MPTLQWMKDECKKQKCQVLYIHTKGASEPDDFTRANCRRKFLDVVVDRYQECLDNLRYFDVVSINFRADPHPHFSAGNMFWANSDYVKTLPDLKMTDRWEAEWWILTKKRWWKRQVKFNNMISYTFI